MIKAAVAGNIAIVSTVASAPCAVTWAGLRDYMSKKLPTGRPLGGCSVAVAARAPAGADALELKIEKQGDFHQSVVSSPAN